MSANLAASVRARLLNVARAQGAEFNQVLVRFALERLVLFRNQRTVPQFSLTRGLRSHQLGLEPTTAPRRFDRGGTGFRDAH